MKVFELIAQKLYWMGENSPAGKTNCPLKLSQWVKDNGPSGSGIDRGTGIRIESSGPNKLVLTCSFHHMDEHGYYDGWTEHKIVVTPTMICGPLDVKVTGKDRNQIKDHLAEVYLRWLKSEAEWYSEETINPYLCRLKSGKGVVS